MPKVQRKRKWLSNDQAANASLLNSKKQLTISSDTLKAVIPNKDKVEESATAVADESVTPTAETDQKNRRVISANGDESTKRKVILEVSKTSTRLIHLNRSLSILLTYFTTKRKTRS